MCNTEDFKLWHVGPDGGDEFLNQIGYACTGVGDTFAYTLLNNFYSNDLDIEKGELVAYTVLPKVTSGGFAPKV